MNIIFINLKNSKTLNVHKLLLNMEDNINVKKVIDMLHCQISYTWKNVKQVI